MAVTLYRQIGKGKARRYQKVSLGRGRRPADLTVPYFQRYSLADGTVLGMRCTNWESPIFWWRCECWRSGSLRSCCWAYSLRLRIGALSCLLVSRQR